MKHQHTIIPDEIRPSLKEIGGWSLQLQQLHRRIAPRFARPEPRRRALLYLQGILSEIPRKNSWQLAEHARQAQPYGMQRLLSRAAWDTDGVRDDVRAYVLERLGTPDGAGAIAVLDESGFPKRGKKSAGVKKQHCGVTGRVENCQVGVFLTYVTTRGHALIDRDLYLPEDWLNDRERCQEAGIADTVQFHPKWELALHMLERTRGAGLPFQWVVADAVYGRAVDLRTWLEKHGYAYVLAIACNDAVCVQSPHGCLLAEAREADATLVQEQDWQRLSMSQGTKGPRLFDWALLPVVHQGVVDGCHWLLIRRCTDDPDEKAYYLVFAPPATTLQEMVSAIGARWHIEEDLEARHPTSDSTSMRSEASSDGIVTLRLSCSPMPSLLVFACKTRVIFLPMLPQSKLNPHSPFFPSPPPKCVTSWPDSSFPCPLMPHWYRPGHRGVGSTSIGPVIITAGNASKQDSGLCCV